jgi:hypothetical protein
MAKGRLRETRGTGGVQSAAHGSADDYRRECSQQCCRIGSSGDREMPQAELSIRIAVRRRTGHRNAVLPAAVHIL